LEKCSLKLWEVKVKKLLVALLLSSSIPAQAAILQIDIVGNLYQVSDSVSSRFSLNDAVNARLVIDTEVAGSAFYSDTYLFSGAVVGGYIKVDGYTATFSNAARAFVSDDEFGGAMDRFLIDDYSATAAAVNGMAFNDLFLNWQDNSATASQGFTLPNSAAAVAAYGLPYGGIDWLTSDGNNRITFTTSGVSVVALPEASTWAMMIVGMGLVGASLRRRKVSVSFA
jgi:hypothetical protein